MLETALHLAIRRRYEDIVEILVCAGADLGATAQGGPTALVVALTARVKRSRKYARFLHYNPDTRWTAIFRTLLTQPASSELPFRRRSIAGLPCPLPGQEEDSASKHGCTMPPDSWTRRRPRPWLPATLGSSAAVPSSAVATDSGSLTSLDRGGLEAVVRARLSDEREKPPRRRSI
ncbi:hypothetical protein F4780DRAFT_726609 [Xylariomycetidae sp. FL0641]|nr:hypothetical protein F4780DRAFT_726609 [Xylariomycetidae sp. FL0641]